MAVELASLCTSPRLTPYTDEHLAAPCHPIPPPLVADEGLPLAQQSKVKKPELDAVRHHEPLPLASLNHSETAQLVALTAPSTIHSNCLSLNHVAPTASSSSTMKQWR
ncbi:hypothetical protein E2562_033269 [Oryza meyeriana var. granulata]|uniref:Uncharacterized protein n=1 Tax=Oryza meyeriana var. granulata TaxID=110450 RepID=A0A6G1CVY9_9ORYZ|nr:hypothetical protein E2562_033269 [Oryza meyeriana var. granulata]